MSWLLWRQHRNQAFLIAVAVGSFAIAVLLTGEHMAHVYDDAIATCNANGTCDFIGSLFRGYGAIVDIVHLSIALPIVLGAFLGATLIARETEQTTNVLVWTQTVTRRRWLFGKVATVLAATLVTSTAVTALVTWWSGTPNAFYGNRFEGAQFDTQNLVPIAFALFAVSLGIASGALFRRLLPALATTVGLYVAVRTLVAIYLRPHYAHALTVSTRVGVDPHLPSGSWTLNQHLLDASGRSVEGFQLAIPHSCRSAVNHVDAQSCLARLGYHSVVRYQPAGRYWHFQWIEAGLYVVLAIALLAFAMLRTLRHDA